MTRWPYPLDTIGWLRHTFVESDQGPHRHRLVQRAERTSRSLRWHRTKPTPALLYQSGHYPTVPERESVRQGALAAPKFSYAITRRLLTWSSDCPSSRPGKSASRGQREQSPCQFHHGGDDSRYSGQQAEPGSSRRRHDPRWAVRTATRSACRTPFGAAQYRFLDGAYARTMPSVARRCWPEYPTSPVILEPWDPTRRDRIS